MNVSNMAFNDLPYPYQVAYSYTIHCFQKLRGHLNIWQKVTYGDYLKKCVNFTNVLKREDTVFLLLPFENFTYVYSFRNSFYKVSFQSVLYLFFLFLL